MTAHAHDPGGKVRLALQDGVIGDAGFSACGRYRDWLSRQWERGPMLDYALWIGLNPSTAGADVDDPTVRREIEFTKLWGYRGYIKCNVMNYRATDPAHLRAHGVQPCSVENYDVIRKFAGAAAKVIVCYGAVHPKLRHVATQIVHLLKEDGRELWCLGCTADGSPRHPLYLKRDTPLHLFEVT